MRYCDIYDPEKLGNITLNQYSLMMKAVNLKRVDREFEIHLQSWTNNQVKATKKTGKTTKPYYKTFDEFYDYRNRIDEVKGIQKPKIDDKLLSLIGKASN